MHVQSRSIRVKRSSDIVRHAHELGVALHATGVAGNLVTFDEAVSCGVQSALLSHCEKYLATTGRLMAVQIPYCSISPSRV